MTRFDLIISEYEIPGYDYEGAGGPRIVRHTSPFYSGVKWGVIWRGRCMGKSGFWEWEPIPSSRTDEFYRRCRFDSVDDALAALLVSKDPDGPRRSSQ